MIVVKWLIKFILIGVLCSVNNYAQTSNQLETQYGSSVNSTYLIRPNIVLVVNFGQDGQPCSMVIKPKKDSGQNEQLLINPNLAKEIIDEIVPMERRGTASSEEGLSVMTGRTLFTVEDYTNIKVYKFSTPNEQEKGFQYISIVWKTDTWKAIVEQQKE